jgi:riboflavin biosynthesis pyrimidine reductase
VLRLRERLGRGRQKNIFVTGAARINLDDHAVFDGDQVDAMILSTPEGAARLAEKKTHPHVPVIVSGQAGIVDLRTALQVLHRDFSVSYLLCEGGPTLNGYMERDALVDEKFLTVAPIEVGAMVPKEQEPSAAEQANPPKFRPTTFQAPGFTRDTAPLFTWVSCRKVGDHQFNRYRRKSG